VATNPYAAPQARVTDTPKAEDSDDNFIPEGQSLAGGQGWQWIVDGWNLFKAQPGLWIGIILVVGVLYVLVSLIPYLGQLVTTVLTPVIGGGLLLGCRALDHGEPLEFRHLTAGFEHHGAKLAALGGISLLAVIVFVAILFAFGGAGLGLAGGSRSLGFGLMALLGLLVVLGLSVPFYMAMWFAPALVVFHEYDVVTALKASFFACLKNIVPFLIYGLVLLVLTFVAAIPFGLGLLVLGPVVICSVYTAYRDIFFVR
jgi:hypothetical protein